MEILEAIRKHPLYVEYYKKLKYAEKDRRFCRHQMEHLLDIRLEEERERLDGIPGIAPAEFTFFHSAASNTDVRRAYEIMQNQYVLREDDRIEYDTAINALMNIEEKLRL